MGKKGKNEQGEVPAKSSSNGISKPKSSEKKGNSVPAGSTQRKQSSSDEHQHDWLDLENLSEQEMLKLVAQVKSMKKKPAPASGSAGAKLASQDGAPKPKAATTKSSDSDFLELDDLFAAGKKRKNEAENSSSKSTEDTVAAQRRSDAIAAEEAMYTGRGTQRKTIDGLAVYNTEELGINPNSGGTELCPFDCDCCH